MLLVTEASTPLAIAIEATQKTQRKEHKRFKKRNATRTISQASHAANAHAFAREADQGVASVETVLQSVLVPEKVVARGVGQLPNALR